MYNIKRIGIPNIPFFYYTWITKIYVKRVDVVQQFIKEHTG